MFRNCNHLTSISGTILSITDDKEWSAVTTVGNFFFAETFADTPLMTLPAGSFNISNITTVQNYFFDMTFKNTRIMTLPIGSFATSNISGAVGNYFFSHTFRNTWLIGLPAGSFDISKITEVGGYFFSSTFRKTQLIDLPTGSFTNTLLTKSKLEKPGVFERTFYSTKLDIDVSTREPFASIEPSSPKDTFYNTNAYVQPTAGWTTKQIAQRNVLVRDTTAPTAIISYSPNTGTRTSGNVEVLLQFNKIISPIYGRTATGTNAYIKSYSKNIDEPVDFYD
ncbi:MAG: hypothetical protein LBG59_00725 [Candidatus Peribacteria bacterium]|jgi:hypothetical protein|nr:hypothetical protein [Candidatus Peribacteria bacterium]